MAGETGRIAWRLRVAQGAGNLYSHSALSSFRECPWRWFSQYAVGLKDAPNANLAYGHLVHAAASLAIRARTRGATFDRPDALHALVREARRRHLAEEALVPAEQDERIAADALAALQAIPEEAGQVEVEGVVVQPLRAGSGTAPAFDAAAAESLLAADDQGSHARVAEMLAAAGLNAIQVRADAAIHVGERLVVRDWKTNARSPRRSVDDLVARYRPQVHLYAAVLRRRWPGRRIVCDLQAFNYGPPVAVEASEADLDDAARLAGRTIREIARAAAAGPDGFGRNVGDACRHCHVARMRREDGGPACAEGAEHRRLRGWDRHDAEDAEARIRAGIVWPGDDPFRTPSAAPRPAAAGAPAAAARPQAGAARAEAEAAAGADGDLAAAEPARAGPEAPRPLPTPPPAEAGEAPPDPGEWTPEEAILYGRLLRQAEATVEALRPLVAGYVQRTGRQLVLPPGPSGSPGGRWAAEGGRAAFIPDATDAGASGPEA